jgi:glycosyltransferase involved in cell wall biosynthesis
MFSIIIPLYNKGAYIERSIQSVLSQTFQEFELIVVDDGSTDDSYAQLSVISHRLLVEAPDIYKKIRVIQQQNQGVSTARNNGVKLAKYDYIVFLDADDSWEPTYMEEMNGLIAAYPKAGIYGSSYFIIKNGKKRIAPIGVEKDFDSGLINYCQVYSKTLCMPLWTGATILKKRIFEEEHGFKPRLKLGEDFDLWIRVATKYPVAFLNKPLASYHQDVDLTNRAIGDKLYKPQEHMLFTDYGELKNNPDFVYLYERLALYGLLPYYLTGENKKEVKAILLQIRWDQHELKYRLYYKLLPRQLVLFYNELMRLCSQIKRRVNEM